MNDLEKKTTDVKPETAARPPTDHAAEKKSPDDLDDDALEAVTGGQACRGSHG